MFANPSLTTRIGIGKGLGALFGIAGFVYLTVYPVGDDGLLRWGILLWYTTLGAIIGMFGVYTWHPILKLPMPWWFRAPLVGAWLNFVLVFFAYDSLAAVLATLFGVDGPLTSPFWFTAEGALVGLIIGFVATRFGGEGPETVTQPAGAD
ncbi:MAG: hypothetical protein HKN28_03020 [Alphaproteobacteria bacterium]|nr:hypothetical protein [Alphaproteobacteria bacterium]